MKPAVDPETERLIALFTVVEAAEFWPDGMVAAARRFLRARYGSVPRLSKAAALFGSELVAEIARRTVEARRKEVHDLGEQNGVGSGCHLCGAKPTRREDARDFGLATEGRGDHSLAREIGRLAFNAAMADGVPLVTQTSTMDPTLQRCRLVLCQPCGDARRHFLGGLTVSESDCMKHPSWRRLFEAGFTRFVPPEDLARYG